MSGPLAWEVARFGTPLAIGMALQTTFNLVDAYLIAQLPPAELGPAVGAIDPGHVVVLAGTFGFAVSIVMVKSLTRTESVVSIIFWMLLIQSAIGLVPALAVWRHPSVEMWPAILVVAFTGALSHYCMARALANAEAMVVMPMDFLRLPVGGLVGWLLYQEVIDIFTATGALLIVAGNLFNLPRRPGSAALGSDGK